MMHSLVDNKLHSRGLFYPWLDSEWLTMDMVLISVLVIARPFEAIIVLVGFW